MALFPPRGIFLRAVEVFFFVAGAFFFVAMALFPPRGIFLRAVEVFFFVAGAFFFTARVFLLFAEEGFLLATVFFERALDEEARLAVGPFFVRLGFARRACCAAVIIFRVVSLRLPCG